MATDAYTSPFLKHLSHFDRNKDGVIHFGESLRSSLALGLNFPLALGLSLGLRIMYGSWSPFSVFRGVPLRNIATQRTQLENVEVKKGAYNRTELVNAARGGNVFDRIHVLAFWAMSADAKGLVSDHDLRSFQRGTLLGELEYRRRDRSDVLLFKRGGPFSVSGHAYFVQKLFGVNVYQDTKKDH